MRTRRDEARVYGVVAIALYVGVVAYVYLDGPTLIGFVVLSLAGLMGGLGLATLAVSLRTTPLDPDAPAVGFKDLLKMRPR